MWGLLRLSRKKFVEEALTHNKEETFLVPHWNKKTLQIQQKQKRTASTIVAHRFSAVGLHGISISQTVVLCIGASSKTDKKTSREKSCSPNIQD